MLKTLRKVLDVVEVLSMKGGADSLLRWRPRSLESFRIIANLRRDGLDFGTIIDGGANVGQFARAASWGFPHARIFSFEPVPEVADRLRRNLSDLTQVTVDCKALGDKDAEITFYRNAYSQNSSALMPVSQDGGLAPLSEIQVPVARLDSWMEGRDLPEPILLKLDLQGYELPALRGAEKLLARTNCVLVEAIFNEVYIGEPPFEELWRFLDDCGFRLLRPVAATHSPSRGVAQLDVLFARREKSRTTGASDPSGGQTSTIGGETDD